MFASKTLSSLIWQLMFVPEELEEPGQARRSRPAAALILLLHRGREGAMEEQKEEKRGRAGQKKEEAFPFFLYKWILHVPTWLSAPSPHYNNPNFFL